MAKKRRGNKVNERGNQVGKKYIIIKDVATICISLFALVISFFSLQRNNHILTPKFSLEVLKADESNSEDLNRIFKIYNAGGQIVNPKISPIVQMELYCVSLDKNKLPDREAIVLVGISDYFSENYSYNNSESSFIIRETKANELYEMMGNIQKSLKESNDCINLFSIKYYFEISYYDYKGEKESKVLCPMNNYAVISYKNSNRERYFRNNELIEESNRQEDILIPVNLEDEDFVVCQNKGFFDFSSTGEKRKSYEYISSYIINYLKKYSKKLERDKKNGGVQVTNVEMQELIRNDKEFVIGAILKYEHKNRFMAMWLWTLVSVLILLFLILIYFKKKKKNSKRNRYRRQ